MKSPAEKMNEFKEELEEKNPIKKTDLGTETKTTAEEIPEKKSSYTESAADKSRTNKGPIGIDRDADQL
jgi:hypothetical protein